ncbi:hypothetical protein PPYR_06332 [Photinus pyralis]|uniref:sphinganine-1-phosphate aldolase n=1 Tax=Photinus pyralis TaxID=7054 RepID=A0A1Y1NA95_PHOPY|nr:sphingosine-1-phosphate lyase [Photinus pyralis]XP_031337390.1 sphingosine-1-phosphate lyase [Photinus pyralis]XP_031337391.1 sphingosine-1-phosphate lyase [Photinus pyralis]KAB0800592.1 hypothetical protein PPYR_06332 [Photinus pyralis]
MEFVSLPVTALKNVVNNHFSSKEPWQIVTITTSTVLLSVWIYEFIFQDESVIERAKRTFFKYIRLIPSIRKEIDLKMAEVKDALEKDVREREHLVKYITQLPTAGLSRNDILRTVDNNLNLGGFNWKNGKVSGTVYYSNPELLELVRDVYAKTSYTNPLHPDVFPGLCKIEAEVVKMGVDIFYGDAETCGTMTTGGTESILMACKAYRDYALEEKGIKKPEMVIPTTAHSAFHKASLYFKIRIRYVPIDPHTTQVNIKAMKRAINSNTIMLVGSAPNFPYGTMDDISAISELGLRYNIPVHVDSCLGGFLTAFMAEAGYPVPICDFRLPGVTSISADTHKYGFTPKGSSIILYSNRKFRHHQYTVTTEWPGGVYGSPTVNGSRAGGTIAVCWATMLNFGKQGYIRATREIIHTTKYIEKGLRDIKSLYIFGQPATSVIAIGSCVFDIYRLSASLIKLGWNLNILQFPSGIHICITHVHTQPGVADQFLNDVRDAVGEILEEPQAPVEGKMAIYGVAQSVPDRSIVVGFTRCFLDSMYYTPTKEDTNKK